MYHCVFVRFIIECRVASDVTFALDSSGSVGRNNFLVEIDFVRSVVMGLNTDETRVAALRYANTASMQFALDDFSEHLGRFLTTRDLHSTFHNSRTYA